MNMIEIERALRELRLSGIAATLNTRVLQAQSTQEPFLETFAAVLQDELDRRRSRLIERRFKKSGLSERPSLVDFDWRFNPKLPRQACFELHTLKFITEGANALIIGKPGTGKSHVAKAVAYQATLQGYEVRYVEADTEFAQYGIASASEQAQMLRNYVDPDLLVLDDLFLARRIADASAEALQAIVHRRYKLRRSVIVTSNRVVQDWGKYLGDATMASTILDRLMHHAHMLEFEGKSYRLKEASARIASAVQHNNWTAPASTMADYNYEAGCLEVALKDLKGKNVGGISGGADGELQEARALRDRVVEAAPEFEARARSGGFAACGSSERKRVRAAADHVVVRLEDEDAFQLD